MTQDEAQRIVHLSQSLPKGMSLYYHQDGVMYEIVKARIAVADANGTGVPEPVIELDGGATVALATAHTKDFNMGQFIPVFAEPYSAQMTQGS